MRRQATYEWEIKVYAAGWPIVQWGLVWLAVFFGGEQHGQGKVNEPTCTRDQLLGTAQTMCDVASSAIQASPGAKASPAEDDEILDAVTTTTISSHVSEYILMQSRVR